jgi:hypothetical protein
MERWFGIGNSGAGTKPPKRKKEDDGAETKSIWDDEEGYTSTGLPVEVVSSDDSLERSICLKDTLLEQLGSCPMSNPARMTRPAKGTEVQQPPRHQSLEKPVTAAHKNNDRAPPTKRAKTASSTTENWAQCWDCNTRLVQEPSLLSPSQRTRNKTNVASTPRLTQDFELDSGEILETGLPKTAKLSVTSQNGVIVRDFAYFHRPINGSRPGLQSDAPTLRLKSRTQQSKQRSFGRKPTIPTPSPKTTATCSTFTAVQCSFSADYRFSLSTQILQAIEDGASETEDEDEEVYLQALKNTIIPDHVLMPPPLMTLGPKVFKPPAPQNGLFAGKNSELCAQCGAVHELIRFS